MTNKKLRTPPVHSNGRVLGILIVAEECQSATGKAGTRALLDVGQQCPITVYAWTQKTIAGFQQARKGVPLRIRARAISYGCVPDSAGNGYGIRFEATRIEVIGKQAGE